MRSSSFTLLHSAIRSNTRSVTRGALNPTSAIQHHLPRRTFTCSAPASQNLTSTMTDISQEQAAEVQRLAEPAINEVDILDKAKTESTTKTTPTNPGTTVAKEASAATAEEPKTEKARLPALSPSDFRTYNSMAEHMNHFHAHFRQTWTLLHDACVQNRRPAGLSLKQFLGAGIQFCAHLSAHHDIEERHIFPVLATRMPEFQSGKGAAAAELLRQHREIHRGMDTFDEYLKRCRAGETELDLRVLKEKMDSWGAVLWTHLDQEVLTLGAENMRRYWTLEEMRRMPM